MRGSRPSNARLSTTHMPLGRGAGSKCGSTVHQMAAQPRLGVKPAPLGPCESLKPPPELHRTWRSPRPTTRSLVQHGGSRSFMRTGPTGSSVSSWMIGRRWHVDRTGGWWAAVGSVRRATPCGLRSTIGTMAARPMMTVRGAGIRYLVASMNGSALPAIATAVHRLVGPQRQRASGRCGSATGTNAGAS